MAINAIIVDSREPDWVQDLKFGNAPKMVTALEFGDIWATTSSGDLVVIERKTPSDLLGSIKDGRIFPQVQGMKTKSKWAYVVITGSIVPARNGKVIVDERVTGWDYRSVMGAILSIQEAGAGVLFCSGDADFEATVTMLCNRSREAEKVIEPRQESRPMSTGEVMLTALPGIGIERAKKLLESFNNRPAEALAWLTWVHGDPCFDIEGIGAGTKRAIRVALKLGDNEQFDLVTLEGKL